MTKRLPFGKVGVARRSWSRSLPLLSSERPRGPALCGICVFSGSPGCHHGEAFELHDIELHDVDSLGWLK